MAKIPQKPKPKTTSPKTAPKRAKAAPVKGPKKAAANRPAK